MMDKEYILLLATVVVLAAYIFGSYIYGQQVLMEGIEKIISRDFPEAEITGGPWREPDCNMCAGDDCMRTGEPCYKVFIDQANEKYQVAIAQEASGEPGNVIGSFPECPECDTCQVTTTYETETATITSYNVGCSNPVPTCGDDVYRCRECASAQECISSSVYVYKNDPDRMFEYIIIGSSFYGNYIEGDSLCVLTFNSTVIFNQSVSEQQCAETVVSHASCLQGGCGFI